MATIKSDRHPILNRSKRLFVRLVLLAGVVSLLFLASVIAFILYARHAAHHMPDTQAADEITAAGGDYQRDSIAPILCLAADGWVLEYGPVIWVYYRAPLTVAKMSPLVKLSHLQRLTISPPNRPMGVAAAKQVPSEPAAWPLLAKLQTLQQISVAETDIHDADLMYLAGLPELRRVDLWGNPNLTPDGVDKLRKARPDVHINYP